MPWNEIENGEPIDAIGGVRALVQIGAGYARRYAPRRNLGQKCSGWHAYADARRMPYEDLIIRAANDEMRCIEWTERSKTARYWMTVQEIDKFAEVEGESLKLVVPGQRHLQGRGPAGT